MKAEVKKIIVIDPGLLAAEGHHAGLSLMLANSVNNYSGLTIEFIGHKKADHDLKCELELSGCGVSAQFTYDFYQYYDQDVSVDEIQPYILTVIKEYIAVIEKHSNDDCIFLYPTLTWIHAYCLAIALKALKKFDDHKGVACLLFNPEISYNGEVKDQSIYANNRLGYRALSLCQGIELYASGEELSWQYSQLLGAECAIPIHPCYLAHWASFKHDLPLENEKKSIILYIGAAKQDKGFNFVADMAKALLSEIDDDTEIYVQYTNAWSDADLLDTEKKLSDLAKSDNRLKVFSQFLSHEKIHELLKAANLFIFCYDGEAYQDKNSGLLWCVSWYGTPCYFQNRNWLSREAHRLDLPCIEAGEEAFQVERVIEFMADNLATPRKSKNDYGKLLFGSFLSWIINLDI